MNLISNRQKSEDLFSYAKLSIPGGVNSPVRAFKSVGGNPVFMEKAEGAYIYDADGNSYIDYINSWGPMILGHNHPVVVEAVKSQATKAFSFGAPTEMETKMAELVKSLVQNVELIRFVSSGTEACMSALRLARGYTGKNKFIKFEGCYHGHADPFLVKAGSGVATFDIQTVPGIPAGAAMDTLTAKYNDLDGVISLFEQNKDEIAAVIIEPVAGNMGCVLPKVGFLEGLRSLCTAHNTVLIFDEVMTGFRLAAGGAQEKLNIKADLITFGKIIGGGLPVGAFGGKKEIMECLAPLGKVYQAGTLSGNPLAMAAGIATLSMLKSNPLCYNQLEVKTIQLANGIQNTFSTKGIPVVVNQLGSMISVFFSEHPINNFDDALATDIPLFNRFFHHMLNQGIYLPPAAFETWFVSTAISDSEIDRTILALKSF
ncbi:glutamate-1-semialdehyde 2,1-aminomutase [Sediminibacterium salmoneum]|uniref:glutamate-1-semialdehyde 2,1-aminomutase n=1 Tax=Sediminibacterium salmoneum TaxID=426421 RepID=UPI00055E6E32|nr:glutamate-1-semialdehyde 2,1-aminomutase [Sediminibacterium salmoneum]